MLDWPPGSEVLVSAITHPGMVAILQAHGLRAVPVDLDLDTLAPSVAALEAARTERTRGLLVAHLFGGRLDLAPLLALRPAATACCWWRTAPRRSPGRPAWLRPGADVSLFSFGLIKTASAAGGALVTVADAGLLARLRVAHRRWPPAAVGARTRPSWPGPRPWSSSTTPAGSSCCSGRAGRSASTSTA